MEELSGERTEKFGGNRGLGGCGGGGGGERSSFCCRRGNGSDRKGYRYLVNADNHAVERSAATALVWCRAWEISLHEQGGTGLKEQRTHHEASPRG